MVIQPTAFLLRPLTIIMPSLSLTIRKFSIMAEENLSASMIHVSPTNKTITMEIKGAKRLYSHAGTKSVNYTLLAPPKILSNFVSNTLLNAETRKAQRREGII